jgi:hypothetical protein
VGSDIFLREKVLFVSFDAYFFFPIYSVYMHFDAAVMDHTLFVKMGHLGQGIKAEVGHLKF